MASGHGKGSQDQLGPQKGEKAYCIKLLLQFATGNVKDGKAHELAAIFFAHCNEILDG